MPAENQHRTLEQILVSLDARVGDLSNEIQVLNQNHEKVRTSSRRQRIVIYVLAGIVGFAIGFFGWRVAHNQDRLQEVQQRTSNDVLCPLYQLLTDAVNNPSPEQLKRQQEDRKVKEAADRAREVILQGFATLGCKPVLASR